MNKPNVLLFDIDNTLLDFSAGAMQAMEEIFRAAGLPYAPEMFAVFQVENDKLWARIERGELTIAGLRDVRWQTILARLGLEADGAAMEDAFRTIGHGIAKTVYRNAAGLIALRQRAETYGARVQGQTFQLVRKRYIVPCNPFLYFITRHPHRIERYLHRTCRIRYTLNLCTQAFLRKNIQYFITVGINTYCTDYTAVKTEL